MYKGKFMDKDTILGNFVVKNNRKKREETIDEYMSKFKNKSKKRPIYFNCTPTDAAGLAFSYAKDIVVAIINNKQKIDVTDLPNILISIAEPIAIKLSQLDKQLKSSL